MILAAGDGGRLGQATSDLPKPLVPLASRPIIQYTLEALSASGVSEAVVVTGYRGEQLRQGIERLATSGPVTSFVENANFEAGASLSLQAAREACGTEPFLLLMADHMLSHPIIESLREAYVPGGPSLVATDAAPWPKAYVDEATRVQFAPGTREVVAIAKQLSPWDALDTGAFLLSPDAWQAIDAVPADCELSVIFSEIARRNQLLAVDVSGAIWYDIDTAADLEAATRIVAAGGIR